MHLKKESDVQVQVRIPFARRMGIYDSPVFHALIRHERCRIDRSGGGFALVVFEACDEAKADTKRMRDRILKAMRSIDEVGWLGEQAIGVLLPITTLKGGRQFARRIFGDDDFSGTPKPYKVFTYPDNWIPSYSRDSECPPEAEDDGIELPEAFRVPIPRWKRALDLSGSLLAILLLWPIMLAAACYIKIVSPGPAIFKQKRVGYGGKVFMFYKFRTMRPENSASGHKEHIVARIRANESLDKFDDLDARIISGGRFLRSSCIDELPQLFNVVRGDMSLVGPRPCVLYEAREYLMWHHHRFDVLPGMTGIWQVSGKNKLTFLEMMRLDISYTEHLSFWRDVWILLRTPPTVLGLILEAAGKRFRRNGAGAEVSIEREAIS